MYASEEVLKHLFSNQKFLKALRQDFNAAEFEAISAYSQDSSIECPEVYDRFYDWFSELFHSGSGQVNVLTIGWDSSSWGSGGNGNVRFLSAYGVVGMISSDYSNDHTEIFDKDTFCPWEIESIDNEIIEISSDVYDEEYLLNLAISRGLRENKSLTINNIRMY